MPAPAAADPRGECALVDPSVLIGCAPLSVVVFLEKGERIRGEGGGETSFFSSLLNNEEQKKTHPSALSSRQSPS